MTLIGYAGKDPRETQVAVYRWPVNKSARPKPYVRPSRAKSKPVDLDPEEIRQRVLHIFRKRGMPVWARHVVEEVANRTGVSLELIASNRRFQRAVNARNEAIYLLKDQRAVLSMPILGKWFDRDHTAIMHSIACHSERTGAPALTGYDLDRARRRVAAYRRWKSSQEQGEAS